MKALGMVWSEFELSNFDSDFLGQAFPSLWSQIQISRPGDIGAQGPQSGSSGFVFCAIVVHPAHEEMLGGGDVM